jgi:hypothetical protein
MANLKEWLQYKLDTVQDINVSSASSWIAEFTELEQLETNVIQELARFNEWQKGQVKELPKFDHVTVKKSVKTEKMEESELVRK